MENTFCITNEEWIKTNSLSGPVDATRTRLHIRVHNNVLTEHYNLFSKTVENAVKVSAYPLAMWLLHSWWRLFYDVYSENKDNDISWRMAHEIAAANEGFVWPRIAFVSDLKSIYLFAAPTENEKAQSVRYLNGLQQPVSIDFETFERALDRFIDTTIERLTSLHIENDLEDFAEIIREERSDKERSLYRRIEAQMGYDPDEADEFLIRNALKYLQNVGASSFDELIIASQNKTIENINYFSNMRGIPGSPQLIGSSHLHHQIPWKQAITDAQAIRRELGNEKKDIVTNETLFELLGVASNKRKEWDNSALLEDHRKLSVSSSQESDYRYFPRKKHPQSKRFEMTRFIADAYIAPKKEWLVQSDCRTARQKYQKAFAAEFLCPIDGLMEYLNGSLSDDALEDASEYFQVSPMVIESQLANHGYLPVTSETSYRF